MWTELKTKLHAIKIDEESAKIKVVLLEKNTWKVILTAWNGSAALLVKYQLYTKLALVMGAVGGTVWGLIHILSESTETTLGKLAKAIDDANTEVKKD